MCSVGHKNLAPVYLVHISTSNIAKLLEYLGGSKPSAVILPQIVHSTCVCICSLADIAL